MEQKIIMEIGVNDLKTILRETFAEGIQSAGIRNEEPDKVLTVAEVLTEFKITKPTLYNLRKKGIIPFFNRGKNVRFSRRDVLNALKNHKAGKQRSK